MKTCKHFNGVQNDKCKKGIAYDSLAPTFWALPCIEPDARCTISPKTAELRKKALPCMEKDFGMSEEKEEIGWAWEFINDFKNHILPLINKIKKDYKGRYYNDIVECPKCNGELHIAKGSGSSHTKGKCRSDNCLQWIE